MAADIQVFGAKELEAMFKSLPNELNVKILQSINRSGAAVYKSKLQETSPVGSDNIYNSIKIERDKEDGTGLLVGPGTDGFTARWIEFGTVVRQTKGKGPKQFKSAGRGTIQAKPFVLPAIETSTPAAIQSIFVNMGKKVSAFLKSHSKKFPAN